MGLEPFEYCYRTLRVLTLSEKTLPTPSLHDLAELEIVKRMVRMG